MTVNMQGLAAKALSALARKSLEAAKAAAKAADEAVKAQGK